MSVGSDKSKFIEFLKENTQDKSDSNWRQIKASLVFYLRQIDIADLAADIEQLENAHVESDCMRKLTSAQKKKSVSIAEENEISLALKDNEGTSRESYWDKPTLALFKAGLLVGLRPSEWKDAILITEQTQESTLPPPLLKVRNGKQTNGRSFGEYRYIGLNAFNQEELLWIRITLAYAGNPKNKAGEAISFESLYDAVKQRLYAITKMLYPKRTMNVTLYSCRHQLIANLKYNKRSLVEIACIVGHGNDVTATEHYGKSRVGRKCERLPAANPNDLTKIKQLFAAKDLRLSKSSIQN